MLSQLSKEEKMIIGVIVVAALGVMLWVYNNKNTGGIVSQENKQAVSTSTAGQSAATATAPATTPVKKTTTTKPPTVKAGEDYATALKTYSNWRFQFVNCQASPGSFVIKKGSKFMLDNRDAKTHTFKVGTAAYSLGAYGWTVATAYSLGNLNVTCDGINRAILKVVP